MCSGCSYSKCSQDRPTEKFYFQSTNPINLCKYIESTITFNVQNVLYNLRV